MFTTETPTTRTLQREVYNRLPSIESRFRNLDWNAEARQRRDTRPISEDEISAFIAVAIPATSALSPHEIWKCVFQTAWLVSPTTEPVDCRVRFQARSLQDGGWKDLYEKLESFRQLQGGWDGFCAPGPNAEACLNATEFLGVLSLADLRPSRLKPTVVGGVGITFRCGERKVYIEFYNDGRVHALASDGETDPKTWRIHPSYSSYLVLIKDIREYLNA